MAMGETDKKDMERYLLAIHAKLDLLWVLLGDMAEIQGFPRIRYVEVLNKEWEKVNKFMGQ